MPDGLKGAIFYARRRFAKSLVSRDAWETGTRVGGSDVVRGVNRAKRFSGHDAATDQVRTTYFFAHLHLPQVRSPRAHGWGWVSVRALILALGRFGIATPAKTKTLERGWAKYRNLHGLDLYGKSLLESHRSEGCCKASPTTSSQEQ